MFTRTKSSESTESTYLNISREECSYGAIPDNERTLSAVTSGIYEEVDQSLGFPKDKEDSIQDVGSIVVVLLLGRRPS